MITSIIPGKNCSRKLGVKCGYQDDSGNNDNNNDDEVDLTVDELVVAMEKKRLPLRLLSELRNTVKSVSELLEMSIDRKIESLVPWIIENMDNTLRPKMLKKM